MIDLYGMAEAVMVNVYGLVNSGKTIFTLHTIKFLEVLKHDHSIIHHYGESSTNSLNNLWGILEEGIPRTMMHNRTVPDGDCNIYHILGTNNSWAEGDVVIVDATIAFNGIPPVDRERAIKVLRGAGEFRKVTIFINWQMNRSADPTTDARWEDEDTTISHGKATFDFRKYVYDDEDDYNDIDMLVTKTTIND